MVVLLASVMKERYFLLWHVLRSFAYATPTLFELATAYASGIVRNHPFVDGNKRTGFLAAFNLNGQLLQASEDEAVTMTLGLASRDVDEAAYTKWLEDNCDRKG
jgi:death on curing protein